MSLAAANATTLVNFAVIFLLIVWVGWRMLATRPDPRLPITFIALVLSIPVFSLIGWFTAHVLPRMTQVRLDWVAREADQWLFHCQPSRWAGQALAGRPALAVACFVAYFSLQGALTVAGVGWMLTRPLAEGWRLVRTVGLNFALAVPCYLACPVAGPAHVGEGVRSVPNGMPSVHTSTGVLILYFAWRWPVARWLAAGYLALVLLAILGLGEHYLVDLVAGAGYAAGVVWLGKAWPARKRKEADEWKEQEQDLSSAA